MPRLHDLHRELRRRNVYRVALAYAAVAFIVWQVADMAFPSLGLPPTAVTFVLALTVVAFPLALVLAWAYEVKPDPGVAEARRRRARPGEPSRGPHRTRVARGRRQAPSRSFRSRT